MNYAVSQSNASRAQRLTLIALIAGGMFAAGYWVSH